MMLLLNPNESLSPLRPSSEGSSSSELSISSSNCSLSSVLPSTSSSSAQDSSSLSSLFLERSEDVYLSPASTSQSPPFLTPSPSFSTLPPVEYASIVETTHSRRSEEDVSQLRSSFDFSGDSFLNSASSPSSSSSPTNASASSLRLDILRRLETSQEFETQVLVEEKQKLKEEAERWRKVAFSVHKEVEEGKQEKAVVEETLVRREYQVQKYLHEIEALRKRGKKDKEKLGRNISQLRDQLEDRILSARTQKRDTDVEWARRLNEERETFRKELQRVEEEKAQQEQVSRQAREQTLLLKLQLQHLSKARRILHTTSGNSQTQTSKSNDDSHVGPYLSLSAATERADSESDSSEDAEEEEMPPQEDSSESSYPLLISLTHEDREMEEDAAVAQPNLTESTHTDLLTLTPYVPPLPLEGLTKKKTSSNQKRRICRKTKKRIRENKVKRRGDDDDDDPNWEIMMRENSDLNIFFPSLKEEITESLEAEKEEIQNEDESAVLIDSCSILSNKKTEDGTRKAMKNNEDVCGMSDEDDALVLHIMGSDDEEVGERSIAAAAAAQKDGGILKMFNRKKYFFSRSSSSSHYHSKTEEEEERRRYAMNRIVSAPASFPVLRSVFLRNSPSPLHSYHEEYSTNSLSTISTMEGLSLCAAAESDEQQSFNSIGDPEVVENYNINGRRDVHYNHQYNIQTKSLGDIKGNNTNSQHRNFEKNGNESSSWTICSRRLLWRMAKGAANVAEFLCGARSCRNYYVYGNLSKE